MVAIDRFRHAVAITAGTDVRPYLFMNSRVAGNEMKYPLWCVVPAVDEFAAVSFNAARRRSRFVVLLIAVVWCIPNWANTQFEEWSHQGTLVLLTTPDGADLPESALEEKFPVLVRLTKETFDFGQAQADGSDLRFSQQGQPLAYQIEQWDSTAGTACIWVRIPIIRGNGRQEFQLHWGKNNVESESSGADVFNKSNGYAVVMHLGESGETVRDEPLRQWHGSGLSSIRDRRR